DVVVVAGFTASPGLLRSMVERAFDLGAKDVEVMIGAALHPIDEDVNAWETAFAGVSVMVHESLSPGVRVTRSPSADEGSGAVLHGLLKALGAGVDLATKNPRVPDEPTVPVAPTTPTASKAPQKSGGNKRKKVPERSVQTAARFSRRQRRAFLLGGLTVTVLVSSAVSVGLVALFGRYFIAVLLTLTTIIGLALALRTEQHHRRLHATLDAAERATGPRQAELARELTSAISATNVGRSIEKLQNDLTEVRRTLSVSRLVTADAHRMLHKISTSTLRHEHEQETGDDLLAD
ncbi:hypothetical protein, partial [Aeromicrobium sp.]|uniref:hypothetical protein n=1 Tax=Aeromicrobium sp. TaxID=1871063 RepID=UPI00198C44D3